VRDRLEAVPVWLWLGGIVVVSFALRAWLARSMVAPFVMVDELVYSELARSLAEDASFAVRGSATSGYSLLYPLMIAPAYLAFDGLPTAYGVAKGIGALSMSLAALPVYFLARRVVGKWLSLLAAVLAVALPSMAYTGTITTESLFYPLSLVVALVLLLVLESPSWGRLALLGATVAAAFATRSQGLVFVPVAASAPLVLALLRGEARTLRPFLRLYVVLGVGAAAVFALQTARGENVRDLLGAYAIVGEGGYDAGTVLRFWLWHVEELLLYAAIVPVVALVVLLARARSLSRRLQEHLAVTVASLAWGTLVVAAFASRFASDRVQDRYLFYLVPLLVVVLLAWVHLGAPRPALTVGAAAGVALALVLLFPFSRFIGEPAKSDTLGLIPLWTVNRHLVAGEYWATVALVGLGVVVLFVLVPARYAVAVPLVLLGLFAVESRAVWSGSHGFVVASKGALFQGIRSVDRDWVDRAVPPGEEVVALWTGRADRFTVNQNEFFNRRVGRVYYTEAPTPGGVNETPVSRAPDEGFANGFPVSRGGVFYLPNDATVDAPYALLDGSVTPDGVVVARDRDLGTTLWRLTGPLSSRASVSGLYADGNWSGPVVTWTLLRCRPGTLTAAVHSDASLFRRSQRVSAVAAGERASIRFRPDDRATLRIRVSPGEDGRCSARFTVAPTAVPAEVLPGSTDDRRLGVHFDALAYEPDA
jgi:positive regulator of sigma E activity